MPVTPNHWPNDPASVTDMQGGTTTLVLGISPVIVANITASCSIVCTLRSPLGVTLTTGYAATAGARVNGTPGSFRITAMLAAGTINILDGSTVDWMIAGP